MYLVMLHFLGECISGNHDKGKYQLTTNKTEVSYYKTKAECLLNKAKPLMDIYRIENKNEFNAFILSDSKLKGNRRRILSSLPIHTISNKLLLKILKKNKISEESINEIIQTVATQRKIIENILETSKLEDEITILNENDFKEHPPCLSLAHSFYPNTILYEYEDYLEHLDDTKDYMKKHKNYELLTDKENIFKNINITIFTNKWVMISKNTHPTIHFVIKHPKLRNSIENFIPPVIE